LDGHLLSSDGETNLTIDDPDEPDVEPLSADVAKSSDAAAMADAAPETVRSRLVVEGQSVDEHYQEEHKFDHDEEELLEMLPAPEWDTIGDSLACGSPDLYMNPAVAGGDATVCDGVAVGGAKRSALDCTTLCDVTAAGGRRTIVRRDRGRPSSRGAAARKYPPGVRSAIYRMFQDRMKPELTDWPKPAGPNFLAAAAIGRGRGFTGVTVKPRACSYCDEVGHNVRTCTKLRMTGKGPAAARAAAAGGTADEVKRVACEEAKMAKAESKRREAAAGEEAQAVNIEELSLVSVAAPCG
jgi:hypothetical protein